MSIPPILTHLEKERRYTLVRRYIREANLDALLVVGEASSEGTIRYLTGQYYRIGHGSAAVLIPGDGEPVLFLGSVERTYFLDNYRRFAPTDYWVQQVRPFSPDILAGALKEYGLERARVGATLGTTLAGIYLALVKAAPHMDIVDVTRDLMLLRRKKSDEELCCVEGSVALVQAGWEAVRATAQVGMTDHQLLAAAEQAMYFGGADKTFNLCNLGRDITRPIFTASHQPITAKPGDWVLTELTASYGGYWTQNIYLGCFGRPPQELVEMFEVSKVAVDAAAAGMRPGVPCSEIARTLDEEVAKAGYQGNAAIGGVPHGHIMGLEVDELTFTPSVDVPVEEGWAVVLHANVVPKGWSLGKPGIFGPSAVYVVTRDGARKIGPAEWGLVAL